MEIDHSGSSLNPFLPVAPAFGIDVGQLNHLIFIVKDKTRISGQIRPVSCPRHWFLVFHPIRCKVTAMALRRTLGPGMEIGMAEW
jgi:hypothetical protein